MVTPTWKDLPDAPGLWVATSHVYPFRLLVTIPEKFEAPYLAGERLWFGPIPEPPKEPKA